MGVAADMNFTWKMFRSHNVKKKKKQQTKHPPVFGNRDRP